MLKFLSGGVGGALIAIVIGAIVGTAFAGINANLEAQTKANHEKYFAPASTGCPANTNEGVYFERGRDEQGNALCGFAFYNPCPYTEAVSADDPMCYKGQPVQQSEPARAPEAAPEAAPAAPANPNTCGGAK